MSYGTLEARREAREDVARPGRFEGEHPMVPILWGLAMDGFADDEALSANGEQLYSRIGRWIVYSDSQGFVYGRRYESESLAQEDIDAINAEEMLPE